MNDIRDDHAWFHDQLPTAISGGLEGEEQARFDTHAAQCAICAEAMRTLRDQDNRLRLLFSDAQPSPGFEDRIIRTLRTSSRPHSHLRIPPAVRLAVTGVAAAVVLGAFGYVVNQTIQTGRAPVVIAYGDASNIRDIDHQAMRLFSDYSNYGMTSPTQPTALAKHSIRAEKILPRQEPTLGANVHDSVRLPSDDDKDVRGVISKPTAGGTTFFRWNNNSGDGTTTANGAFLGSAGPLTKDAEATKTGAGNLTLNGGNTYQGATNVANGDLFFKPRSLGAEIQTTGADASRFVTAGVVGAGGGTAQPNRPAPPQDRSKDVQEVAQAVGDIQNSGPAPQDQQPPQQLNRKIIRNGAMEFEVDRFDSAFAIVSKLANENNGYIGTTQSEKLPNGKVKGSIIVRVPPDRLDTFVLQLRGIGDLKSQKLEAQDISKQYSDLESELKADRAMEERLLEIIKTGKGEIKDLLAAEKELAVWRGKIEKTMGEMKYYDNLVALSTLTITVYEKDIKTPAAITETETIDAGVETPDVEKARAQALDAIEKAKGRIIQSDLKRYDAGQFGATIVAEVSPDASGPLLDHLKQIGKVARLDIQRHQATENNASAPAGAHVDKKDTRFNLSLYNLANVAPRQTATANLAVDDVEAAYKTVLTAAEQSTGRVVTSALNRQKPEQTTATLSIEVPSEKADEFTQKLKTLGEMMKLSLSENPDTANVTTAKKGFSLQILSSASVPAREQTAIQIATSNVQQARQKLLDIAATPGLRIVSSQLNESDPQNVTAFIDLEVRRDALPNLDKTLTVLGDTLARNSTRSADTENTIDSKLRLSITLTDAQRIPPRETTTLGIETSDVEAAIDNLLKATIDAGGRSLQSTLSHDRDGRTTSHLVLDVPLAKSADLVSHAKSLGAVRLVESTKDSQAPQGALSQARLDITLANSTALVPADHGFTSAIRQGLATSITGLVWSLEMIVIGLCFVGPWALLLWAGWRWLRRRKPTPA